MTVGQSAATHAAMHKLVPIHTLKNALMMDILPYTIDVVSQDHFVKVLEKGSTMPCKSFQNFTMEKSMQNGITLHVVEEIAPKKHEKK